MVMSCSLPYAVVFHQRPTTWAEAMVSTSCLSGYGLMETLPQLIGSNIQYCQADQAAAAVSEAERRRIAGRVT